MPFDAKFGAAKILLRRGDITKEAVDAIVNAANSGLWGGGGVDGAIHAAGGPDIMKECDRIRAEQGGCPTGGAVITSAGRLSAKFVIHAVGPIWGEQPAESSDELLASAYRNSIRLAHEHQARTIAFPAISTGVYGFPVDRATLVALRTVHECLATFPMEEVRFVLFSDSNLAIYESALSRFTVAANGGV